MLAIDVPKTYSGEGTWHDDAGESGGYKVILEIDGSDTGFTIAYRHVFDNGDPDTDVRYELVWTEKPLLKLLSGGNEIGLGYAKADFLHYAIVLENTVVEANLVPSRDGLSVFGSSTKNSAGRHIMWVERLKA